MSRERKVKILIIEDDLVYSIFVESVILESKYELVGSANTLEKAKAMIDGCKPDILVADIVLQGSTIFKLLEETDTIKIPTVFITNHLEGDYYSTAINICQTIS